MLGAQIPLSTFARTDPAVTGYGLGASASFVSTLIGVYVVSLLLGALALPLASRLLTTRGAMLAACLLVALGYGLFLPLHDTTTQTMLNMAVAGVGSGLLSLRSPPRRRRRPARPHRLRDRHDQHDQDHRRRHRVATFAIALAATGSLEGAEVGASPLSGYLTVWAICSGTALVAALSLLVVPRGAFAD